MIKETNEWNVIFFYSKEFHVMIFFGCCSIMAQAQLRLADAERPIWHDEGDTCPVPGCVGFN
jgi:hypothetical protein